MITEKRHSQISLRLTTAALAHLKKIATDYELKVSDLIRQAIRKVYGDPLKRVVAENCPSPLSQKQEARENL